MTSIITIFICANKQLLSLFQCSIPSTSLTKRNDHITCRFVVRLSSEFLDKNRLDANMCDHETLLACDRRHTRKGMLTSKSFLSVFRGAYLCVTHTTSPLMHSPASISHLQMYSQVHTYARLPLGREGISEWICGE